MRQSDFENPTSEMFSVNVSNKPTTKSKEEKSFRNGRWTHDEHFRFIEAMLLYGNDWKKVQKHIGTRSPTQARSHAQKFFIRIKKKIFKDREVNKPMNTEDILSQIQSFVKHEVIDKIVRNNETSKFSSISDSKDRLSKVLFLMMSNFSKDKATKTKLVDIDNVSEIDYSFKEEDLSNWEKLTSGRGNKPETAGAKAVKKAESSKKNDIFSIEKTNSRKVSLEVDFTKLNPETPSNNMYNNIPGTATSNQNPSTNIFNNQVFNPSGNSYINIVTINVCKNEKESKDNITSNNNVPYLEDNPLDMNIMDFNTKNANFINFINDPKGYLSVNNTTMKAKKEEFSSYRNRQLSSVNNNIPYLGNNNFGFNLNNSDIFNDDFTSGVGNNLNIRFDDVQDEIIKNTFFLDDEDIINDIKDDKDYDDKDIFELDNFFNTK
jgi:SHAQKYF class myb-like DNA-binding protein